MTLRLSHGVLSLAVVACAADVSERSAAEVSVEPLRVLAADEMVEGRTQQAWAIEYARWTYAQTSCDDVPLYDSDGSQCSRYQGADSPVFFLEQSSPSTRSSVPIVTRTRCRVPANKPLFVPVTMVSIDDGGLSLKRSAEELLEESLKVRRSLNDLLMNADGVLIDDLDSRALDPIEFSYHVPKAPNYYSCQDGFQEEVTDEVIQPSYLTGAFVMFEAPSSGPHHIEVRWHAYLL